MIQCRVYGIPQPKGSMRAFMPKGSRYPVLTSSNKRVKQWEQAIRFAAQEHAGKLLTGAVAVEIRFALPRPKSLAKKVTEHTKRPDLDKLVRVMDALTGVIWRDDSQVVELVASKSYAEPDEPPYVDISVRAV